MSREAAGTTQAKKKKKGTEGERNRSRALRPLATPSTTQRHGRRADPSFDCPHSPPNANGWLLTRPVLTQGVRGFSITNQRPPVRARLVSSPGGRSSFLLLKLEINSILLQRPLDYADFSTMLQSQSPAHERTLEDASQKRQRLSHEDCSPNGDPTQLPSKKQKKAHHRPKHPDFPPRKFWEELDEIQLTKNALRALERYGSSRLNDLEPRRRDQLASRRELADRPSADKYLRSCSAPALKRIRRFASHGGPDLRDLRGYPITEPESVMSKSTSAPESSLGRRKRDSNASAEDISKTRNTTTTKTSGPYDGNFQQHLIQFGVYPALYMYPDGEVPPKPDNLEEIRKRLAEPRRSLSPSRFPEKTFIAFQVADAHAAKEAHVMRRVIPVLEGDIGDPDCAGGQIPFRNLDPLTDGTLVPGNPDIYYGARPEQVRPATCDKLKGTIVPSAQDSLPLAPNFFLHVKGPGGSLAVASKQACYDGALGARGMHSLRSYGQPEPQYDNKAYTLTSIYHGGTLRMYTSHLIPPSATEQRSGFAMTQIDSWSLTGNADAFRQGATAYRNGRDWAKRQRDDAIKQANERAAVKAAVPSLGPGLSHISEASESETITTSQMTAVGPVSTSAFPEANSLAIESSVDTQESRPAKRSK